MYACSAVESESSIFRSSRRLHKFVRGRGLDRTNFRSEPASVTWRWLRLPSTPGLRQRACFTRAACYSQPELSPAPPFATRPLDRPPAVPPDPCSRCHSHHHSMAPLSHRLSTLDWLAGASDECTVCLPARLLNAANVSSAAFCSCLPSCRIPQSWPPPCCQSRKALPGSDVKQPPSSSGMTVQHARSFCTFFRPSLLTVWSCRGGASTGALASAPARAGPQNSLE